MRCCLWIPMLLLPRSSFLAHALGTFSGNWHAGRCFGFGLVHAVGLPRYLWDGFCFGRGLTCCFDSGDTVEDGCAGQCRSYGTMGRVFFAAFSGNGAANMAGCPSASADLHDYPSFCFCLLGCDCVFHDVVCLCVIDSTNISHYDIFVKYFAKYF